MPAHCHRAHAAHSCREQKQRPRPAGRLDQALEVQTRRHRRAAPWPENERATRSRGSVPAPRRTLVRRPADRKRHQHWAMGRLPPEALPILPPAFCPRTTTRRSSATASSMKPSEPAGAWRRSTPTDPLCAGNHQPPSIDGRARPDPVAVHPHAGHVGRGAQGERLGQRVVGAGRRAEDDVQGAALKGAKPDGVEAPAHRQVASPARPSASAPAAVARCSRSAGVNRSPSAPSSCWPK